MIPVKLEKFRVVSQKDDDGCGCGFCAMSAVYKYYGLKPKERNLRERLGTDNQSLPSGMPLRDKLDALLSSKGWDTKGTLPMDLFAVLHEDGFGKDWMTPYDNGCKSALHKHLKSGHLALALTADIAHWVVIAGMDEEGVWIADSSGYLDPEQRRRHRYRITHESACSVLGGVILVKRGKRVSIREMTALDFAREYADGAVFGLACLGKKVPAWIKRLLPG